MRNRITMLLIAVAAISGCKVRPTSGLKAIVGVGENGEERALGFLPVRNLPTAALPENSGNRGVNYAVDVTGMPFFALVECTSFGELNAAEWLMQLYYNAVNDDLALSANGSTESTALAGGTRQLTIYNPTQGKGSTPPCRVVGERLLTFPVGSTILTRAYLEKEELSEATYLLAQSFFLSLRGFYNKNEEGKISALMAAFLRLGQGHMYSAAPDPARIERWVAELEKDFNPCLKSGTHSRLPAAAAAWKTKNFSCVSVSGDLYAFRPGGAEGKDYVRVRNMVAVETTLMHEHLYAGQVRSNEGFAQLWNVLTQTKAWDSLPAGSSGAPLGLYLAGKNPSYDFNATFKAEAYGEGKPALGEFDYDLLAVERPITIGLSLDCGCDEFAKSEAEKAAAAKVEADRIAEEKVAAEKKAAEAAAKLVAVKVNPVTTSKTARAVKVTDLSATAKKRYDAHANGKTSVDQFLTAMKDDANLQKHFVERRGSNDRAYNVYQVGNTTAFVDNNNQVELWEQVSDTGGMKTLVRRDVINKVDGSGNVVAGVKQSYGVDAAGNEKRTVTAAVPTAAGHKDIVMEHVTLDADGYYVIPQADKDKAVNDLAAQYQSDLNALKAKAPKAGDAAVCAQAKAELQTFNTKLNDGYEAFRAAAGSTTKLETELAALKKQSSDLEATLCDSAAKLLLAGCSATAEVPSTEVPATVAEAGVPGEEQAPAVTGDPYAPLQEKEVKLAELATSGPETGIAAGVTDAPANEQIVQSQEPVQQVYEPSSEGTEMAGEPVTTPQESFEPASNGNEAMALH